MSVRRLTIEVSQLTPAREPAFIELVRKIEEDTRPGDSEAADQAEQWARDTRRSFDYLSSDSHWVLVANSGRALVAYAALARVPKLDPRRGYILIDELYVLSEHRRNGIASSLVESAAQLAGSLGYKAVRLLVEPENEAAVALYRRQGFEPRSPTLYERPLV